MTEIGTERVEPATRVPDRLNNEPRREPRSRPRRQPPPDESNSEPADNSESSQHQVDSLA